MGGPAAFWYSHRIVTVEKTSILDQQPDGYDAMSIFPPNVCGPPPHWFASNHSGFNPYHWQYDKTQFQNQSYGMPPPQPLQLQMPASYGYAASYTKPSVPRRGSTKPSVAGVSMRGGMVRCAPYRHDVPPPPSLPLPRPANTPPSKAALQPFHRIRYTNPKLTYPRLAMRTTTTRQGPECSRLTTRDNDPPCRKHVGANDAATNNREITAILESSDDDRSEESACPTECLQTTTDHPQRSYSGRKRTNRKRSYADRTHTHAFSNDVPTYHVPTDEQFWGDNTYRSSIALRNHLRSAFQPKRWPAFCKSKGFLLPDCYKAGSGLGLIEPESYSLNAWIMVEFVKHLIAMGEPRNVLIHCVCFLQKMVILELTQRYKLVLPQNFHICHIVPELLDFLNEGCGRRKKLKPGNFPKSLDVSGTDHEADHEEWCHDQACDDSITSEEVQNALKIQQEHLRLILQKPSSGDDESCCEESTIGSRGSTVTRDVVSDCGSNKDIPRKDALELRASLLELSKRVDAVLATRLDFVDGKLVCIEDKS